MNSLMLFEGKEVEVFEFESKILFNPYHVGECLGLSDSAVKMAIAKMNEKQVIKLTNAKVKDIDFRNVHNTGENFLTESGVYKLIFKSNKPNAEKFQDWVTDEVLPELRQTGVYITNAADPEMLRKKADELESIGTLNETAKILLPIFDEAGLKAQFKALALKQIYRKGGLDLPIEELKVDKEVFDLQTIAKEVGIYSSSNKPHATAVNVILKCIEIAEDEKEVVAYEKNGHSGTTVQYTRSVIDKVRNWIIANSYPNQVEYNGRKYSMTHKQASILC